MEKPPSQQEQTQRRQPPPVAFATHKEQSAKPQPEGDEEQSEHLVEAGHPGEVNAQPGGEVEEERWQAQPFAHQTAHPYNG